jgi:hypothetical protein
MHLSAQTLTIIGIPLLGIPALILGAGASYCSIQASVNLKPDSWWRTKSGFPKGSLPIVPRSEFTELGLWYRRQAFMLAFVVLAWAAVIVSFWMFAIWLTA